jgi:hypothetical protein
MMQDVFTQMIGHTTSTAVCTCLTSMFSAQGWAIIRQIRRKVASMKRNNMGATEYLHLMKEFADAKAIVGTPVRDEELIDYIIASLIALFAALEALLTVLFLVLRIK